MTQPQAAAARDDARSMLRHTLATLAYRAEKAVRGAPVGFAEFRAGTGSRSAGEILAHMGDLMEWALSLAEGAQRWSNAAPLPWDEEGARFVAAATAFDAYLANTRALGAPAEQLFQGPIADALTHTGQLTLLRRLAGGPIRGENYARADIAAGRIGSRPEAQRFEFD